MTPGPARVHSGSLSWLNICLHDTTTKCHAGTSHPSVHSTQLCCTGARISLQDEICNYVNAKQPPILA